VYIFEEMRVESEAPPATPFLQEHLLAIAGLLTLSWTSHIFAPAVVNAVSNDDISRRLTISFVSPGEPTGFGEFPSGSSVPASWPQGLTEVICSLP